MEFMNRWRALVGVIRAHRPLWKHIGLAIGGLVLATVAGFIAYYLSRSGSTAVRCAGMSLQVGGLGTVASGLFKLRRDFRPLSVPSSEGGFFRQLYRALFSPPEPINARLSAETGASTLSGEARVILGVSQDAPLPERVSALEQNLNRLREELDTRTQANRERIGGVQGDLRRETGERQAADERLRGLIEKVAVGGLRLEVVGLVWIFSGVVATSIPGELMDGFLWMIHWFSRNLR